MSLAAGTRLGPYEILSPLGAGGMGEVYRARDTRLDRLVAIKILPAHLSENPDARARFQREAKAISGLTHPHICTLHDVGHQDGVDYLVMELLEGGTLADRLDSGPLPLEQVLRYGVEVADALERAHRAGVVHRDLKPGNVMLTKSGVKLLDFGLARMAPAKAAPSGLSALPTEAAPSRPLTEKGTVMGTVQYMAPEQLEGKDADARTDIFALGGLLYEMATGKKAFSGASQASLITAIMSGEPAPISTLAPMTPPAFDRLVRTCLAKDPDERWQSAHDVKSELQWIAQAGSQAGLPAVVVTRRKSRERLVWIAAVVVAAAAAAWISPAFRRARPDAATVRFDLLPPFGGAFQGSGWPSPDGRSVAFIAPDAGGSNRLWIRDLGVDESRMLDGAGEVGNILSVTWSPDGKSIAFASPRHEIRRLSVVGGTAQRVGTSGQSFGLSWGAGVLVYTPFYGSGFVRVPASGGVPVPVTSLDANAIEVAHLWPDFLPDGRRFVFFARSKAGRENRQGWIAAASIDGKMSRRIGAADALVGVSDGYLVYLTAGSLYAQPFDERTLAVHGDPVALPGHPMVDGSVAYANARIAGGTLVFRSDPPKLRRLVWIDRSGRKISEVGSPAAFLQRVAISPDGRRALAVRRNPETGENELWTVDLERGTAARSGNGVEEEEGAAWSPDGRRFLFHWDHEGPYDVVMRYLDGSKPDEVVLRSGFDKTIEDWSRDGRVFLYRGYDPKDPGLHFATIGSTEAPRRVPGADQATGGQLSPDGRWVSWTSSESGRKEVYVERFPDGSDRQQVSVNGAGAARWNPNGKEIFFISPDAKLMSASFDASESGMPRIGIPTPLFSVTRVQLEEAYVGAVAQTWDVAPDGQRFLLMLPVSETDRSSITVVLNWTAQLAK